MIRKPRSVAFFAAVAIACTGAYACKGGAGPDPVATTPTTTATTATPPLPTASTTNPAPTTTATIASAPDAAAVEPCGPRACGPQLGMPNRVCADGSTAGPGPCMRNAAGKCAWVITTCPTR